MSLKSEKFKNAIAFIIGQKDSVQQTTPQKTIKDRAEERLQELGVDRKKFYKFGIPFSKRVPREPLHLEFENPQIFDEKHQIEYMSNPENWLLVHATDYMPENNTMETTAMATGWSIPRATIHFTLNHIVESHMGGSWDDRSIVILTPFQDTVKKNNLPVGFALVDTYFSPDADTGLKLPDSAHIIHPGKVPDGHLFQIKQNETIYKTDNYTNEEINEILSLMPPCNRQIYDNLSNGILEDRQLQDLFYDDYTGRVKKAYDKAKDKQKFLAGIMEDTRYKMLTNFVRQMATHMTIERKGYKEISANDRGDMTELSKQVAITANKIGIQHAVSHNKGHHNSVYNQIEDVYSAYNILIRELSEAQTSEKLQEIMQYYTSIRYAEALKIITDSVIERHPAQAKQIYNIFTEEFQEYYENQKIEDIDKNLDTTIKRYCEYQAKEFDKLILKMKEIPGFVKIAKQIYIKNHNMHNISHER